jgi:hypothetical protein
MPKSKKIAARLRKKAPAKRRSPAETDQAKRTVIKKARFLIMYALKGCNISKAGKAAGNSRSAFYEWRDTDPGFLAKLNEADEADLDFTEDALRKQIKKGNITAIIFKLKTKGKSRGYIEKVEFDGSMRHSHQLSMEQLQSSLSKYGEAGE